MPRSSPAWRIARGTTDDKPCTRESIASRDLAAGMHMGYARHYSDAEPTRADIDSRSGDTLLEFGAPWCGHCIAAQSAIERALSARGDIGHFKIEDGRGRPLGRSFKVRLWPTLVLLRDGVEIGRVVRPSATGDMERLLAS